MLFRTFAVVICVLFHSANGFWFQRRFLCLRRSNVNNKKLPSWLYETRLSSSPIVLPEFSLLQKALVTYRDVIGDLDIPIDFQIPFEPPWPTDLHGMQFGPELNRTIGAANFSRIYPHHDQTLASLGFNISNSLKDEWRIILDGFISYKEHFGDLHVKRDFVVPDDETWPRLCRGLKLGIKAFAIGLGKYIDGFPNRKKILNKMEFQYQRVSPLNRQFTNHEFLNNVYSALKIYKEVKRSDLILPTSYKVPTHPIFPMELHGLSLGYITHALRGQQEELREMNPSFASQLDELGFPWIVRKTSEITFGMTHAALLRYKELNGNMNIPNNFVVPNNHPDWPATLSGLRLGSRVKSIRENGAHVSKRPELRTLLTEAGFNWTIPEPIEDSKTHNFVPTGPTGDYYVPMPPPAHETEAKIIKRAEERSVYEKHPFRKQIEEYENREKIPGDFRTRGDFNMFTHGVYSPDLKAAYFDSYFDQLNMDIFDPHMYYETTKYPKPMEMSLNEEEFGELIHTRLSFEAIEKMKTLKHRMLEFEAFNWTSVLDALKLYKSIFGHVDVPPTFVVDEPLLEANIGFNMSHYGMKLGIYCTELRNGEVDGLQDAERKSALDALGFNWGDLKSHLRFRFLPMYAALTLYGSANQNAFVIDPDFVVPDSKDWPYWMLHMPLGEWCQACRLQEETIRKYYPEKVKLLYAAGFFWGVPTPKNFPQKYFKPLSDY